MCQNAIIPLSCHPAPQRMGTERRERDKGVYSELLPIYVDAIPEGNMVQDTASIAVSQVKLRRNRSRSIIDLQIGKKRKKETR